MAGTYTVLFSDIVAVDDHKKDALYTDDSRCIDLYFTDIVGGNQHRQRYFLDDYYSYESLMALVGKGGTSIREDEFAQCPVTGLAVNNKTMKRYIVEVDGKVPEICKKAIGKFGRILNACGYDVHKRDDEGNLIFDDGKLIPQPPVDLADYLGSMLDLTIDKAEDSAYSYIRLLGRKGTLVEKPRTTASDLYKD